MDKKGNVNELFSDLKRVFSSFKQSYLYRMVSKFLSTVCSIILVILLIIGALMFYFNTKVKSYESRGLEYTSPFGLYTIISGSMEPNVEVYDVVIAVNQSIEKIKVGDVITFISTWDVNFGVTVTHRVVGISKTSTGEIQLTTKGDNNQTADGAKVTQSNLVGKVVGRLPQLGRLQFFLATKMGWFLVVFIPAVIIIILDAIKIFKLYVLKTKIDDVKPINEVLESDDEIVQLEEKMIDVSIEQPKMVESVDISKSIEPAPIKLMSDPELKKEEPRKEAVDVELNEDDTIDTVELPRIHDDGMIKENSMELPIIKADTRDYNDEITLINIPIEPPKEKDGGLPIVKNEIDDLPVIKSNSDIPQINKSRLPQRGPLSRR